MIDTFLELVESDDSFPKRGEPYSVRGDLFLIKAQWHRDASALVSAERDYKSAIKLGSKDPSNLTVWRNDLESVATVRKALFF